MCGIAGIIKFNGEKANEQEIREMTDKISHRGPDDSGVFIDGPVGLGHRRLSIIDLSSRGHQPMSDERGEIRIVFNGEIYNFLSLKKDLEQDGVKFASDSDTEVIIHLYKKYGHECLRYLRGMFAFAIWDKRDRSLFLARDRAGKKPLKYYFDNDRLIFASELKAILADRTVKKEIDYPAIDEFLTYKYVPGPKTGFKNIFKLPPAHYLVVKENGEQILKQYWTLDFSQKQDLSETEWKERITAKLKESVGLRLISDVPLGAHLSGGVDSSLIVALMSELAGKKIKTFSIGFEEPEYNELPFAKMVARKYDTDHHEFSIKPDALSIMEKVAYHYEEPYADASALPTWHLCEATRQAVTVALNGDGGDENFAGYERYAAMRAFRWLKIMPAKTLLSSLAAAFGARTSLKIFQKLERLLRAPTAAPEDFFLDIISYFKPDDKKQIYSTQLASLTSGSRWNELNSKYFDNAKNLHWLDQLLSAGINSHLPDDLLVKVDIASMAHALEIRSPMLDHEFMELCAQMPANMKMRGGNKKYLLKQIALDHLPSECVNRPKKGFSVPLEYWFRGEFENYLRDNLLDKKFIDSGFNRSGIEQMLNDLKSKKHDYSNQLYALLCLRLWYKVWFE